VLHEVNALVIDLASHRACEVLGMTIEHIGAGDS